MFLNNYISQNTTKGFNTISVESNWGARYWTGTALNNKNLFHSPMNSVWMWKSRSLLSEQTRAGKVHRALAVWNHSLLSCFWWSFFSVDSPFLQQRLYHGWLTCMISTSSFPKSGYDSVHWLLDFNPCPAPQQQKVPFFLSPRKDLPWWIWTFPDARVFWQGFFLACTSFSCIFKSSEESMCSFIKKKKKEEINNIIERDVKY